MEIDCVIPEKMCCSRRYPLKYGNAHCLFLNLAVCSEGCQGRAVCFADTNSMHKSETSYILSHREELFAIFASERQRGNDVLRIPDFLSVCSASPDHRRRDDYDRHEALHVHTSQSV